MDGGPVWFRDAINTERDILKEKCLAKLNHIMSADKMNSNESLGFSSFGLSIDPYEMY